MSNEWRPINDNKTDPHFIAFADMLRLSEPQYKAYTVDDLDSWRRKYSPSAQNRKAKFFGYYDWDHTDHTDPVPADLRLVLAISYVEPSPTVRAEFVLGPFGGLLPRIANRETIEHFLTRYYEKLSDESKKNPNEYERYRIGINASPRSSRQPFVHNMFHFVRSKRFEGTLANPKFVLVQVLENTGGPQQKPVHYLDVLKPAP
jgi:hypothetical protein